MRKLLDHLTIVKNIEVGTLDSPKGSSLLKSFKGIVMKQKSGTDSAEDAEVKVEAVVGFSMFCAKQVSNSLLLLKSFCTCVKVSL